MRLRAHPALLAVALAAIAGTLFVVAATRTSPVMAVILFVALPLVAGIVRYPYLGFLMTVFVIPLERLGRFTEDSSMYTFSLMRVLGVLALGSFLLHAFLKKWRFNLDQAFYLYFAYWIFALLTISYTTDLLGNVRGAAAILGNLLFFFLVINMVRDWRAVRLSALIWLAASVLIGIYTIYDWHFGQSFGETLLGTKDSRFSTVLADTSEWEALDTVRRAVGPTSHAAVFGINLILTIPFLAYFFRIETRWQWRLAAFLGTLVIFYNIFLTNTRAVMLVTVLALLFCAARRLLIVTAGGLVAALLAAMSMLPFVPDAVYERVLNPANYTLERSGTLRIRFEYWQAGLQVAQEKWLTGIGVGNQTTIPKYIKSYGPEATTVHNEYLQTFIEVGVIGWLLFFGFVALLLRYSFRAAATFRRYADTQAQYWFMIACQIAMVSVLIYGLQVDVFHFPLKGWWLIAGLTGVMYHMARRLAAARAADESKSPTIIRKANA